MKYYLFGTPIGHSLSPLIHTKCFDTLGLSHDYELFDTNDVSSVVACLDLPDTGGGSITIPYKELIIPYLDRLSTEAKLIGAVNTVVKTPTELIGYNTDWIGIESPLLSTKKKFTSALVLGAGGAARGVCYALNRLGIPFSIYNRTPHKAQQIALDFGGMVLEDLSNHGADLLISTVPKTDHLVLDDTFWQSLQCVFDVVYKPYFTPLLRMAQTRNIQTIHGIEMLLTQAYEQSFLWTGQRQSLTDISFETKLLALL